MIFNFFGFGVEGYIQQLEIFILVFGGLLALFYTSAGPWIIAFTQAKIWGGKVAVEYDKTKEFRPFMADIPKDWKSVIELPNHRGVIGIRRESIGHSNKTQVMLFASDFEYTVNPMEISGRRYFSVDIDDKEHIIYGYLFNDVFTEITKKEFDDKVNPAAKMWVRYPSHTVTPEEFVLYQNINADPMLTEGYAQHKENALREKMNNPIAVMLAQYGWIIIIALVAGGLAYQMISQQNYGLSKANELQTCKETIINMFNTGVCKAGSMPIPVDLNQTLNTGGMIK